METFDVVVIGAGPAGEVAAGKLAERSLSVALVEEHLIGGECSFYACMPSKALLRPAEALREIKRIPGAAESVTGKLDVTAALKRRDEVIHDLDDSGQLEWLDERDITLIRGHGRLSGERRVTVKKANKNPRNGDAGRTPNDRHAGTNPSDERSDTPPTTTTQLHARKAVIIATGTTALLPDIDGLDEIDAWTNRQATTAHEVPESLIVLGGGPVGVELAQAWASLGSRVTLVEGEKRLLPREEVFACEHVTEALKSEGVDIRCGQRATKVDRITHGVRVTLQVDSTVEARELLVAIGRSPRVAELGLSTLDLPEDSYIEVDDQMRVKGSDWLYAIGDVNGRVLLTHMGKYQARIACASILGEDETLEHGADGKLSPRVIFTDPQVAAVGHTSASAEKAGITTRKVGTETSGNAGGSFYGRNATGKVRVLIDTQRDVIVGATFTGVEVAEFLHAMTIAIVGEVPIGRLRHAVPAFPTRSEIWLEIST